jgi:two-component system LytT family response regulator
MTTNSNCLIGERLIIKSESKIKHIEIKNVTHITGNNYITTFHMLSSNSIVVSKFFKVFEKELYKFGFIRVNQSTLVNLNHVKEYFVGENRTLELANDIKIRISRRKVYLFRNNYGK